MTGSLDSALPTSVISALPRQRRPQKLYVSPCGGDKACCVAARPPPLWLPIVLFIPVEDFAAGREPDLLARGDVLQRLREILGAVRMPDDEGMQADRHHPSGFGAVFVKHVELVADH